MITKITAHVRFPSNIRAKLGNVQLVDDIPKYAGPYHVTPKAYENTELQTSGKMLEENVLVFEVPYHEVDSGSGNTVYIG